MMDIENFSVLLIRDPVALAVHIYHMTKWPDTERYGIKWEDKIPLITEHFHLTPLELNRALDYLDKCGIG